MNLQEKRPIKFRAWDKEKKKMLSMNEIEGLSIKALIQAYSIRMGKRFGKGIY